MRPSNPLLWVLLISACSGAPDPSIDNKGPGDDSGSVTGDGGGVIAVDGSVVRPACVNGIRDARESDVDCAGVCARCGAGRTCRGDGDCASLRCRTGQCLPARAPCVLSFAAPVETPLDDSGEPDLVTDLDGDGRAEVVSVYGTPTHVAIRRVANDGRPAAPSGLDVPWSVWHGDWRVPIAARDFDGDGIIDLAVIDAGHSNVGILHGRGGGSFTVGGSFLAGSGSNDLVAGDFDGDGRLDIITHLARGPGNGLSYLQGRGDGTFALPIELGPGLATKGGSWHGMAASDLDGDGSLDVLFSAGLDVVALLNRGDGTFGAPVWPEDTAKGNPTEMGWFDEDGIVDSVTRGDVVLGSGDGTFRTGWSGTLPEGWTQAGAVADFDGDGFSDIAITGSGVGKAWIAILRNDRHGGFDPPLVAPLADIWWSLGVGDVNGDGLPDLVSEERRSRDDPQHPGIVFLVPYAVVILNTCR